LSARLDTHLLPARLIQMSADSDQHSAFSQKQRSSFAAGLDTHLLPARLRAES